MFIHSKIGNINDDFNSWYGKKNFHVPEISVLRFFKITFNYHGK